MVREGVGAGGRNNPSLVCTYEKKKKNSKEKTWDRVSLRKEVLKNSEARF
jgi:hypothetical protein